MRSAERFGGYGSSDGHESVFCLDPDRRFAPLRETLHRCLGMTMAAAALGSSGCDVLVVGAGPAGLALACLLQAQGCRVVVAEKRSGTDNASRATGLRAASLRLLDQLGLKDEIVARGCALAGMQIYRDGRPRAFRAFAGSREAPIDNLSVRQPDLEAALRRRALALGATLVEATTVTGVRQEVGAESVRVRAACPEGDREVEVPWLVGADGARSVVRRELGIAYEGSSDPELSFVLDCTLSPTFDPAVMHYYTRANRRLAIIPLDGDGVWFKLSGDLPRALDRDVDPALLRATIEAYAGELVGRPVRLGETGDYARYRISRRLASRFQVGRAFLVGDAAHSCPPNGGWGLNTALADAANLAWKLAGTVSGRFLPALLESFARERRETAAAILAFTDAERRRTFAASTGEDGDEAEFLTRSACDGTAVVAPDAEPAWAMPLPGSSLWEWAARREALAHLPVAAPGSFTLVSSRVGETASDTMRAALAALDAAGIPSATARLPADGPERLALVRPDGIVALVDMRGGRALVDWTARIGPAREGSVAR